MIEIDGSHGEGGGQIIRSALALSAVTGKPFSITNIRARRSKSGLLRQHLTGVNAAREICNAEVDGNELHSSYLKFIPGTIQPGDYRFSIGSAGSSTLVAQTLIPALMMADRPSSITVEGGTHNMAAPPIDYLQKVFLPQLKKMGPSCEATLERYGFYPAGGGLIKIAIEPVKELRSLNLCLREGKLKSSVSAIVSKLPAHIGERECDVIRRAAGWKPGVCNVIETDNSPGPGNVVMIELASDNVCEIVTGFGKVGVKAEDVARQTYREAKAYIAGEFPVGEYLADQLLMPVGLAAHQGKTCKYVTCALSSHSKTHIEILQAFLDVEISISEAGGKAIAVKASPKVSISS